MNIMELMWIYRHAWRGAGLYYRKGDHVVTQDSQEDKPTSVFKAMTMYPVWDKWIMPRCDAVPQRYLDDPERWALTNIDDARGPQETPPLGPVRWEHLLLDQLSHELGNLFRLWYEDLHDYERSFWRAFMQKASQKQEYRWEDFRKEDPPPIEYEAVKNFDPRFFYYYHYSIVTESLLRSTSRFAEEAKCMEWAILEEDLEPGLALDPTSYAAKARQRKRKEPPTEAEVLSSVRKRPSTPPQEGTCAGSPVSTATTLVSHETLMEAVGTPTSAAAAPPSQESTPGQTQPMDVSQSKEQLEQEAESQLVDQQHSQDTVSVGTPQQQPAEQSTATSADHPGTVSQEEMSEPQTLRKERTDKLTRIMLEVIYGSDIGITPAAEVIPDMPRSA